MSIRVADFKWEKGINDARYIELLEKTLKNEQRVTALAMAKVRKLAKENQEIRNAVIDEFVERIKEVYPFTILELEQLNELAEEMRGAE